MRLPPAHAKPPLLEASGQEKGGRRVVFDEIVILYREVLPESGCEADEVYFRDFDDEFHEVD
jgi:hypothetical protein